MHKNKSLALAAFIALSSLGSVAMAQDGDMQAILAVHNQERAAVGVEPLAWDASLASAAQAWADKVVGTGSPIAHDSNRGSVGENMAAGAMSGANADYPPLAGMANGWVGEKAAFTSGNMYDPAIPAGHYSQMIWRGSTAVGCGTATADVTGGNGAALKRRVLVCRYSPAGNVQGQAVY